MSVVEVTIGESELAMVGEMRFGESIRGKSLEFRRQSKGYDRTSLGFWVTGLPRLTRRTCLSELCDKI